MNNRKPTLATLAILAALAANAATPPGGVTPFTFCGRVTDASRAAFDDAAKATIFAYDASSNLLARTETFYRADSRRNYALNIPMVTSSVGGYAVQSDQLSIAVVDDAGKRWEGVVPLPDSVVDEPGGVKELDIVLSEPDADTKGVDGDLYWTLYADWWGSDANDGGAFDPNDDHDGDGVSTLQEAYAGTDPFDASSKLAITAYAHGEDAGEELSFPVSPSRAYSVECATNLSSNDWKAIPFTAEGSTTEQSVIACPASTKGGGTLTVVLKPADDGPRFFRIRME